MWKRKGVGNVSNPHTVSLDQDADHIEAVGVVWSPMPVDPN